MSESDKPKLNSLDDLIAINREIAALVRAGIPLELGLRTFAGGMNSTLGRLANRIATRLGEGMPLATALQFEGSQTLPVYSAVISAGIESGKLSEALESVADSAQLVQDTGRYLRLSLIYPAIVCAMAYFLFCCFVSIIVPMYIAMADDIGFGGNPVFEFLRGIHSSYPIWGWLVPLLVIATLVAARMLLLGRLDLLPVNVNYMSRRAQFAELLQIQVSHGLPLAPSLHRAAEGTGDRYLIRDADVVVDQLQHGVPFAKAVSEAKTIPPMMRWILATSSVHGTMAKSLTLLRDSWRRRAVRQSRLLKVWIPSLLTCVLGGTVTLAYGLMMFAPLRALWEGLMQE